MAKYRQTDPAPRERNRTKTLSSQRNFSSRAILTKVAASVMEEQCSVLRFGAGAGPGPKLGKFGGRRL